MVTIMDMESIQNTEVMVEDINHMANMVRTATMVRTEIIARAIIQTKMTIQLNCKFFYI